MQKLILCLVLAVCTLSISAQKANQKFIDGIVYFQVKSSSGFNVKCDANGHTDLKMFAFLKDIPAKYGITRIDKSFYMAKDEKLLRTYKVFFTNIGKADQLIAELAKLKEVEYAEKLPMRKFFYVPNDPIYSQTSGSGSATMHFNWPLTKINAASAWNITKGSASVKVAIVDNAIYTAHPDLTNKIVAQRDVADLDNIASPPGTGASDNANYEWSHGTHVAGLVGAQSDNGIGVASIGYSVSLVAVKIAEDATGNLTAGYEGITWASTTGNAKIINMSWGGYGSSTTEHNVVTAAYNAGCVLVAAAGNNGDGGEDASNTNGILYPAAYTECIAVGATNSDDTKATFSEYGTWVDVMSPGGNEAISGWSSPYVTPLISTTWCNTYGINAYYGLSNSMFGTNAKYDGMQGTSMASPLVAGVAGLILSVNPSMTNVQVRNCITSTADNINSVNSGYTGQIGSGRVNALAAVQCAQSSASVAPSVAFIGAPLSICPGSTVSFTNQTTSSAAATYTWTFQGGTPATSTQTNVTVTYNTPGVYSVTLTAHNTYGTSVATQTAYVNVVSGATLPLVEGFQSSTYPPANWSVFDAGSDNVKWALSTGAGQASTQSTVFDNFNTDVTGTRDQLNTYVNLSSFTNAKMTFYRAYGQTFASPNIDSLEIRVSTNCGSTSTQAYYKGGTQIGTGTGSGSAIFVPTSAQWAKDSIDLSPYVGNSSVMISIINRSHYGDGLYLDNINITGSNPVAPTATISAGSSTVCVGQSLALTNTSTGSPTSYAWTMTGGTPSSANTSSTTVSYSSAGVKTISLTVATGTLSSTSTKTVTVIANPTINATPGSTTICAGQAVSLSASGGTSYSWMPGNLTAAAVSVSPASTTVYTVTGTSSGCSATNTATVSVNASPSVNISGNTAICSGSSATLTASGATSYVWAPGGQTTSAVTVSPSGTAVYTVTGTSSGCSATQITTVTVTSAPSVSVSATSTTICNGTSASISASGASSYTWNPGNLSGASISVSPANTTTYTVTGANGGCAGAPQTSIVNVNASPVLSASATTTMLCAGQSTSLTATGATSYTWNPGNLSGAGVSVMPSATTTYTVTGTSAGCNGNATVMINVSTCTGIDNLASGTGLSVYPNPNNGEFYIVNGNAQTVSLQIFNSMGQLVLQGRLDKAESRINLSSYGKGLYYVQLSGSDFVKTVKLVAE